MKNTSLTVLFAGVCLCLAVPMLDAQTRILPLGDSVTSSFAPHSSYRYWLDHYLHNAGIDFDFVGTESGVANGGPGRSDFDQDYAGGPGWTTQTALDQIDSLVATQPDVVLLDLGANDVGAIPLATTRSNIRAIIDQFRAVNPNVVILLAYPTSFVGANQRRMHRLKDAMASIALRDDAPGSPVIGVDLFDGFNPRRETFDGMHPNDRGERFIARKYFDVLRRIL